MKRNIYTKIALLLAIAIVFLNTPADLTYAQQSGSPEEVKGEIECSSSIEEPEVPLDVIEKYSPTQFQEIVGEGSSVQCVNYDILNNPPEKICQTCGWVCAVVSPYFWKFTLDEQEITVHIWDIQCYDQGLEYRSAKEARKEGTKIMICDQLTGRGKDHCYLAGAILTQRDSFCEEITDSDTKLACQGILNGNIEFCEDIEKYDLYRACYSNILDKSGILLCEEMENESFKRTCIKEVAIREKKPEYCDRLPTAYRYGCYKDVAVYYNDVEICKKIPEDNPLRMSCFRKCYDFLCGKDEDCPVGVYELECKPVSDPEVPLKVCVKKQCINDSDCSEGYRCREGVCSENTCADGTPFGECSENKPEFCIGPKMVKRCTVCGCPEGESCNPDTEECEQVLEASETTRSEIKDDMEERDLREVLPKLSPQDSARFLRNWAFNKGVDINEIPSQADEVSLDIHLPYTDITFYPEPGLEQALNDFVQNRPSELRIPIILQLKRKISLSEYIALFDKGVQYEEKIKQGNYLIASVPAGNLEKLIGMEHVRWIGLYKPSYKYDKVPSEGETVTTHIHVIGAENKEYQEQLKGLGIEDIRYDDTIRAYIASVSATQYPKVANLLWTKAVLPEGKAVVEATKKQSTYRGDFGSIANIPPKKKRGPTPKALQPKIILGVLGVILLVLSFLWYWYRFVRKRP